MYNRPQTLSKGVTLTDEISVMMTSPEKITTAKKILKQDITLLPVSGCLEKANQILPPSKFVSHKPQAGLNPLVDASAYLFSILGKLKSLKSYRHLKKLHEELITEINLFSDNAKSHGYNAEYILVSRYALCASLDDIITNAPWGAQGQWDNYRLLNTFNGENNQQERFFIILERIIKEPSLYIDLMEFMYICLSLGFKGSYRTTEFNNSQLEQICNALYKCIRAHHGDFSKTLSPYPLRSGHHDPLKMNAAKKANYFVLIVTAVVALSLFFGLGYVVNNISNQVYQELIHIGKSLSYESHDS
jgi:type VI secretion system protein ImpK